jgi:hypothetical protein
MTSLGGDVNAAACAGPSPKIEVVIGLIPFAPKDVRVALGRLVQRRLTTFNQHEARWARLGLLVRIVSVGTGDVPSVQLYTDRRSEAAEVGEDWPTASTLSVAYGGWTFAVRAAMRLWLLGTESRVSDARHHQIGVKRAYRPHEACEALRSCRETLGAWPTEFEYEDWRRAARLLAHACGQPAPRLPSRPAWMRLFGSWPAFETEARGGL